MKKILLLTLILVSGLTQAQYKSPFWTIFPIQDSSIVYTEVVTVDSTLTANELFKNAKIWMVDAFASSKDVIQNQDDKNFILIGKGLLKESFGGGVDNVNIYFSIKIETKDSRYRYSIYDLKYFDKDLLVWGGKDTSRQSVYKLMLDLSHSIDTDIKSLISSMKSSLLTKQDSW